ncbi:CpaD family pilus assembly protein [Caulobacter henricii]|uniref:Pilus assembly protein CpaD n=1 Tax=Caulobacter henricii TaxID=69395 RepID=A0A0P0P2C0_9CAUL|nr:CpaD family pilus assembly lipoprotein [Caulobacter henricii]ALL14396.1 pilus assembly protein CpaD [Caulobacter henricii]
MSKPTVNRILKSLFASAVLLTLSACATGGEGAGKAVPEPTPRLATEKWTNRIKVDGHPDEIQLAAHATGVSANQDQALRALVSRWLSAEAREIVVSAPLGGGDPAVASRMAMAVRERLVMLGAPAPQVRLVGYDAAGNANAAVRVGFEYFVAEGPRCGQHWENLTATRKNETYDNFGCALAANLAAQIASPEDLIRPRDSTAIDAGRRDTVLGKYRKGETTSSAKDDQANGAISKAIN